MSSRTKQVRTTTAIDLMRIDQLIATMRRTFGLKKAEIVEITDGLQDVPGWQQVNLYGEILSAYS